MKKTALILALTSLALPALAAETAQAPPADPMAAWKPPRVTREARDRKEIAALWKEFEQCEKKGDVHAAAALVDFPVLMVTDDSRGQAMGETWSREQWTKVMEPFYKSPNPDMKVTHRPQVFLMSDSLATVNDVVTVTTGPKKMTARNSTLVIRKDGKWLVKAMTEGGWGDVMGPPATASQPPAGGDTGTGSGSSGSGPQGTTAK